MRNDVIDLLRFLAAWAVVAIHLAPNDPAAETFGSLLVLVAVPFFYAISLYFFFDRHVQEPAAEFLARLAQRLVVPYLAWTVIYCALIQGKGWFEGRSLSADPVGALFYGQTGVQMYFLPVLIFLQLLAWLFFHRGTPVAWAPRLLAILGLCAFAAYGAHRSYLGWTQILWTAVIFIGLPAFARLVLQMKIPGWHIPPPVLVVVVSTTYGIYLVHFALIEAGEYLFAKIGHPLTPYSLGIKILVASVVTSLCVGIVLILRRLPLTRVILLGESQKST